MATKARFWLLASCLTLFCVRNAFPKIVQGTLNTKENWTFIDRFLYKKSFNGQLKYHFEYPSSYATQNVIIYFDTQWPSVYPQPGMKCLDREDKVNRGYNQVINLTTSYIWSGCKEKDVLATQYLICDRDHTQPKRSRDYWWYIALSNCESLKGLVLKYKLEMTNEGNADEKSSTIKCHHCTSTKSWDDCGRVYSATANCFQSDAVCYKIHYETNGVSQYAKSCGQKSYCHQEANPICKDHAGSTKCDIHCCDDNLCNAGSIVGVSVLFLAAGVLVAIMSVKT